MALQISLGSLTAFSGWSTALASVAASGTSTSGAVTDNNKPGMKVECEFTADAASTATVDLYLIESLDAGTDYSTTAVEDMRWIGTVTLNGTTTVRKILDVWGLPEDFKVHVVNNDSSNGLGTSTVSYQTYTFADV